MALDPTLSETLYRRSVRKFFRNEVNTVRNKDIFFDRKYSIPKDDQGDELNSWIVVHIVSPVIDTLSVGMLQVYCFSRQDPGLEMLSDLRDTILDILVDETQTDGLARVPLLDYDGSDYAGMVAFVDDGSEIQYGADGTNFKIVSVELKWGAK